MASKFVCFKATASALLSSGAESVSHNHGPGHLSPSPLLLGWGLLPKGHTPGRPGKACVASENHMGYRSSCHGGSRAPVLGAWECGGEEGGDAEGQGVEIVGTKP